MRARALRFVPRASIALALVPVVWLGAPASPASAAVPTAPNPPIEDSCGLTVTLVLDASGSIQSSNAVADVRGAATAFLDSLRNTGSSARVTQFATVSEELAPSTLVDDAALAPGGDLRDALAGYYDPKPPRPLNVNFYRYNGGPTNIAGSFKLDNAASNNQYTNWDQGLHQAGTGTLPELVVFLTDGDPTAYDFEASDPIKPPHVAFNTSSGPAATPTLDRAVVEANAIKIGGARMLTVGVGAALGNPASVARLTAVTGPKVVTDAELANVDSLNDIDVALVTNFQDLAAFLRSVVLQLCSPSLTIRKLAQTAESATYVPAPGWSMQTTPTVPGGNFRWILPDTTPAASKTVVTDANGFAQFQWEPSPSDLDSRATVQETLRPGYTAGRPDRDDFSCEFRDEKGDVRRVSGELSPTNSFTLDPIREEIGTCTVWNSFNYQPAIAVTKSNAPTEVRGDLIPATTVTSSYVVTNPGNTPLSNVHLVDNQCGPVTSVPPTGSNAGDTDQDGLLDPGEAWQFTCARGVRASRRSTQGGTSIVNTVTAFGTPPTGTTISAQATDDVLVFTPGISLTKLVNGQPAVTVATGTQVTYTYAVTNTGNTPLSPVSLVDNTPPCQAPTRGADSPGNGDTVLDLGEVWNYSCVATPTAAVTNTATATGVPLNPVTGVGFPDRNPPVSAVDRAEVDVVTPGVSLDKAVTPDVVVVNPATLTPQPVTYTFAATNTGTTPLNRPGAPAPGSAATDPGWVADARCTSPAVFTGGDVNANQLLDPGETWTFTCPGLVAVPTENTATITGQPSDAAGAPLPGIGTVTDDAEAFVDVVSPAIEIDKTSLRPVVVDPAAQIVEGPDLPRRPAEYTYDVTNTGTVALDLTPDPPVDDRCAPLTFVGGDENNDGLLDIDETWSYTCSTLLSRSQGTPPPTGNESAFVRNTVTATGIPSFEGTLFPQHSVTATDNATVLVIQPAIAITKSATPPVVLADGSVTYSFAVSNPGDVGLQVIGPSDDQCAPLEFTGGDTNGDGFLAGANSAAPEVWNYECTRPVPLPAPPATTIDNTVSVSGVDPLGNLYTSESAASVRVFRPDIDLVKTVSAELVPVGREVTYGFDVTNTGISPIAADDVLENVRLTDASLPPAATPPGCASPTFVGGDTNSDGRLDRDPAELWRYECTGPITQPTTDLAIVTGTAGLGFTPPVPVNVVNPAVASVRPFHPAIDVIKTAEPTQLLGGGPVTYTYEVRNTGDVPLADVASRITDDTCSPVTFVSGDIDGDGLLDSPNSIFEDNLDEVWIFTCTVDLSATTTNTVVVTGTPTNAAGDPLCGPQTPNTEPCDVTDEAVATVIVTAPGSITVVKEVTDASTTAFAFDLAGTAFSLTDGGSRTFDPLAPGTYVVTETRTQGYALTTIVCEDPGGGTTVDVTAGTATVGLGEGEAVTCTFTNTPAPEADLEIEKSVDEDVIAPGDTVVYTLTVTNLGPDDAQGVVVTDELPDGVTVISYPDECVLSGTTLTCDIGDLAAGDSVSLEVEATVDDTGLFSNVASVDSETADPDPDNNDSSADVLAAETTPQTGTDIDGIIRAGSALVLLGSILVVVTLQRRRRRLV